MQLQHQFSKAFLLIFTSLILLNNGIFASVNTAPATVDLSAVDFEKAGIFKLRGSWDFYWKELLYAEDFTQGSVLPEPTMQLPIPFTWNQVDSAGVTNNGYGTYRILMLLGANYPKQLALNPKTFSTAARIYANGELVWENGIVGTDENSWAGGYAPKLAVIEGAEEVELILQVANFNHRKGGAYDPILIGALDVMQRDYQTTLWVDFFLLGSMLIMGIYQLSYYFFRKKEIASLYFGLSSLSIGSRILFAGNYLIMNIYPDMPWELFTKLEYLGFVIPTFTIPAFAYSIFKEYFHQWVFNTLKFVLLINTLLVLFTPLAIYSHLVEINLYLSILIFLYIVRVVYYATLDKKPGVTIFALGITVLFVSILNDQLLNNQFIESEDIVPFGFHFFFFSQAFVLSYRSSKAFTTNELLTEKLNKTNANLEVTVAERTYELKRKHEELTSSINYAWRIQQAILPAEDKAKEVLSDCEYFIFNKPRNIVSGDFYYLDRIDNKIVLVVADCTGHGVPGAFMSLVGSRLISEIITKNEILSPSAILAILHQEVRSMLKQATSGISDGMDLGVCVIDPKHQQIHFAGARTPLLVVDNDDFALVRGDRMSVGGRKMDIVRNFTSHTIPYQSGAKIYMYSDGYQDQFGGPKNRKFMAKNFRHFLLENAGYNMEQQETLLAANLIEWQEGAKESQTDDILVVGLRLP
ncbi:7TM diverse intracellular signaling domain-containing protein [Algivirga pacifica]|uniref:PPM-type phosphatase domain-containing protein n=1 Tax=Algivirga pacifica TaxID=1162670 RepID=A0ABP9DCY5_9BACT